jgi:hypothetical protein
MGSRTASVLPLPVGAIKRTFSPLWIKGIASTCGRVGSENPNLANAFCTGFASRSKTLESDDSPSAISQTVLQLRIAFSKFLSSNVR